MPNAFFPFSFPLSSQKDFSPWQGPCFDFFPTTLSTSFCPSGPFCKGLKALLDFPCPVKDLFELFFTNILSLFLRLALPPPPLEDKPFPLFRRSKGVMRTFRDKRDFPPPSSRFPWNNRQPVFEVKSNPLLPSMVSLPRNPPP